MKKAWVYKRKNRQGWYVGWYVNGKQRSKMVPTKVLAKRYARRLEYQFNEDIFVDPIDKPWDAVVEEYLHFKKAVVGLKFQSIRAIRGTLKLFKSLHGPVVSTKIDQRLVYEFIAHRIEQVVPPTVNKDVRNLSTFVNWLKKNRYSNVTIEWIYQKEPRKLVRALTPTQLNDLLIAAKTYSYTWYLRVLLAVTSGVREMDIESLTVSSIDFESATVMTRSQKTGKGMPSRPLHPVAVEALTIYLQKYPPKKQNSLFADKFNYPKWIKIRTAANLPDLKFHDLRVTFASLLAQAGFSTSVVQALLEHSTPNLTHSVYTDVSPVYRKAVESIPVKSLVDRPPQGPAAAK